MAYLLILVSAAALLVALATVRSILAERKALRARIARAVNPQRREFRGIRTFHDIPGEN